jgi:putative ABC transport system permease protein
MLMGDTAKYIALIFGLAFSTTLVVQQGSIFTAVMNVLANGVNNVPQAQVWVMHPATTYFDERKAIEDTALQRVRGVQGVAWAEPYLLATGTAVLPDGSYAMVNIVGVDRVSKLGLPQRFDCGDPDDLLRPDSVFWDHSGIELYKRVKPGDVMEINDRRARIVGQVFGRRTFTFSPTIYTTYERALDYAPGERKRLTFVLAGVQPGQDPDAVAERIRRQTGLGAKSSRQFFWSTVWVQLGKHPAPVNFAFTVGLGVVVGVVIAAQTFIAFTLENLRYFAALKALGLARGVLIRMLLFQALLVGVTGWGLGAGLAAAFGWNITERSRIVFVMTPHLLAGSFVIVLLTVLLAALLSIRRVLSVEPATVFR